MKFMNIKTASKTTILALGFALLSQLSACVTTNADGEKTITEVTPDSDKADIYAQLAVNYMKKEQYETAQGELEKAFAIMPSHSQSNYIMGLLMIDTEQYNRVEKFMVRAVESDPNNSHAAHDLGTFLCRSGQEVRAIEYFDKAVANPFFKRPGLSLMRAGECLYKVGQVERSEDYLKRSLRVNSNLKPALFNLAKIKYETQSYLSARAYIERFNAITKPQPAALLLGYQIELKLNANDVAEKYRAQLLDKFPASAQARSLRNRS